MTAETAGSGTTSITGEVPKAKTPLIERPSFPLVWKLFGLTALLIVIVVAIAVGITIQRADTIARTTVNSSISGAAKLFRELEHQRLGRLSLPAQLLGNDPTFVAYIQKAFEPATPAVPQPGSPSTAPGQSFDLPSIADQLEQRRQSFGSDLVMLLDDQGRLVARTDQPNLTTPTLEDLYEHSPLVKRVVDDASVPYTQGVLAFGNRLYHAAVAPIAAGANPVRVGYLINALAIDDTFANRIGESTNAGVIFVSAASQARSSNAPSVNMQQTESVNQVIKSGKSIPPSTTTIEKSSYVMTAEPLLSGPLTVGAAVFVRSLDRERAPFKQIENALLVGGGAALLLAFLLTWLIAKRVTRPIEHLAAVAQAVTAGDYNVHPNVDRSDEVGILGRSFAKMITALRDKAELEELYEQMAAKSAERESFVKPAEPVQLDEGTVFVSDIRGLPPVGQGDPTTLFDAVTRVMKMQEAEISRQDGVVREVDGQRMVSIFKGERGVLHAIRAARAINEELATVRDAQMSISVGIATGQFVTGSIEVGGDRDSAIVGNAPLLASIFAWHAAPGYAYISYETAQSAGGEIMSGSTREQVQLKWLPQPLPVAAFPLMNLTTGVMRSIGGTTTSSMATLRLDGTQAGPTAPAMPQADLAGGTTFAGRYRIEQVLGRGGMGVVYRAIDTQLDETVAIKTLPGDVMQKSPEDLERFKREIRLARKITHRNVLRTYDYGEADGVYFISMEFVRGYTLAELLQEAPEHRLAPRVGMGIARQICRGLQAAHEQGIIHRDIKPQNILIDHKGEVKVMDFGIARMAEAKEGMTQAGLIVGTPHYMSPEQVQGKQLDPRSDVYSIGILLYEMLAGQKPFNAPSLTAVLTAHITEKPSPLIDVRPDVGRQINDIVMRCLAKDPNDRYSDSGALLQDLDQVPAGAAAAA